MAKRHIAHQEFIIPSRETILRPHCCICGRNTGHLYRGDRFCAAHHPDPGPNIHVDGRAAA